MLPSEIQQRRKTLRLLIFDFDGVLRPISWFALFDAYSRSIEAVGRNFREHFSDVDSFREWYDIDWHKNEEKIFGAPYKQQLEFDLLFHKFYDVHTQLFPWAEEVLKELSKKHQLAILTSSRSESIHNELGPLVSYFELIVGCEMVTHLKPHPDGILTILEKTGAKPENVFMIGDHSVDVLAGKSASVKTCAVTWGLGKKEDLIALKPDLLLESWEDLLKL